MYQDPKSLIDMSPSEEANGNQTDAGIWGRLRGARKQQSQTLQDITTAYQLAKGSFSSAERNNSARSEAFLLLICEYLNISVGAFFESRLRLIAWADRRKQMQYGSEYIAYNLGRFRHARCRRATHGELEPYGRIGRRKHTYDAAEECSFVQSGNMVLLVGESQARLEGKDCITFASRIPGAWRNSFRHRKGTGDPHCHHNGKG